MRSYLLALLAVSLIPLKIWGQSDYWVTSPGRHISVKFELSDGGKAGYSVFHSDSLVLEPSKLGVLREDEDFSHDLVLDSVSSVVFITDSYTMLHGKRHSCSYKGNRRVFHMSSGAKGIRMDIIFQVSDDGVAYRYYFPGQSDTVIKILSEASSFNFRSTAKAFLQPCMDSGTGWNKTQPSYEEQYQKEIPVDKAAPYTAGWVMPALYKSGKFWICLTETAVDSNYCGSRLGQYSPEGEYNILFPQATECITGGVVYPESSLPWYTPWRIVAISDNLGTLVESTLGTDLATPARYDVSSWLKPGKASWSWIMLKDRSINYDTQKRYIDFAASMKWQYCLVDVNWDVTIGYDKIAALSTYAASKNVRLILWYNSAGDWNTVTFYTPHSKMLTHESRISEFQKLKEMGIAGIKVDFFAGDGQSVMKYYTDILKDAAIFNLAVNFHGCTYPRGWTRTYPNLVSMEAIKGEEFVTFNQEDADAQPAHCSTIPFTRNLFDPMDFTPVNFSGIPGIDRRTTKGFEISLSVILLSGIQHFAESNAGMAKQTDFVQEYMRNVPDSWDDVKFIDGCPGKFVILARKSDNIWYIAGINGEKKEHTVNLQLPFISNTTRGIIITDSTDTKYIIRKEIDLLQPVKIKMYPFGGFVIKTLPDTENRDSFDYKTDTTEIKPGTRNFQSSGFSQTDNKIIRVAKDIEIIKLSDNAYLHISYQDLPNYGRTPANGLIFINGRDAFLFDTPWNDSLTMALFSWITDTMKLHLAGFVPNHWHNDCMGGLGFLQKQKIESYANQMTIDIAKSRNLPVPDNGFKDSLQLWLGDKLIECYYPGPAHSSDNIAVWIPSEQILFAGCMVKSLDSKNLGNTADGDLKAYPLAIEKLKDKFPTAKIVIPGHGHCGGFNLIMHTRDLAIR